MSKPRKYFTEEERRIVRKKTKFKYNNSKHGKYKNSQYEKQHNKLPHIKIRKRQQQLKRNYNIDEAEYYKLLYEQNEKCAICGVAINEEQLVIDHDHNTNTIRGLLCRNCNWLLGHAYDDINILYNAINYLKSHQETINGRETTT